MAEEEQEQMTPDEFDELFAVAAKLKAAKAEMMTGWEGVGCYHENELDRLIELSEKLKANRAEVTKWQTAASMVAPAGEKAIVEILPSYFRPKPAPTRFGTPRP